MDDKTDCYAGYRLLYKMECTNGTKSNFVPLIGKNYELLNRCFINTAFMKYEETVLKQGFCLYLDKIRQMDVRNDDTWVVTFPKSGTTWVQEMVWLIANDLKFEAARTDLQLRFPHMELSAMRAKLTSEDTWEKSDFDSISYVSKISSPRFVKSHLPFHLLPEKLQNNSTSKIIYVMRNAGDVCVSFYHFLKGKGQFKGSIEEFGELFMMDQVHMSSYWQHLSGFWKRRQNPNLLILKFEDMKKDLQSTCREVALFLGKPLTKDQIEKLAEHLSFENMKQNAAVNRENTAKIMRQAVDSQEIPFKFIRCGRIGQWETSFSLELRERFEKWMRQNMLDTGIDFDF